MRPYFTAYSALMMLAMLAGLGAWMRLFRNDRRLIGVYFGALFGAMIGAKLVYLAAEGWMSWGQPRQWEQWLTGKSILGALLGGYLGVELGKWAAGYRAPTGDAFALLVPAGIAVGRIGCLFAGCCQGKVCAPAWWALKDARGVPHWPAVPVEMAFNLAALGVILALRRARLFPGQHFHLYLMAYGLFRFFHEPLRDTPALTAGVTGYQIAALLVAFAGLMGFLIRWKNGASVVVEA